MGELIEIDDEVDWYLDLDAISRRTAETLSPGAIFNKVKGCPPGYRAADFGMGKSGTPGQPWARLAVMLGRPPETGLMDIQHAYLEAIDTGMRQPPSVVDASSAPCKQNKWLGDDIGITKFPVDLLDIELDRDLFARGNGRRRGSRCPPSAPAAHRYQQVRSEHG